MYFNSLYFQIKLSYDFDSILLYVICNWFNKKNSTPKLIHCSKKSHLKLYLLDFFKVNIFIRIKSEKS